MRFRECRNRKFDNTGYAPRYTPGFIRPKRNGGDTVNVSATSDPTTDIASLILIQTVEVPLSLSPKEPTILETLF